MKLEKYPISEEKFNKHLSFKYKSLLLLLQSVLIKKDIGQSATNFLISCWAQVVVPREERRLYDVKCATCAFFNFIHS